MVALGRYGRIALVALLVGALGVAFVGVGAGAGTEMGCAKAADLAMSADSVSSLAGDRLGCIAGGYSWSQIPSGP